MQEFSAQQVHEHIQSTNNPPLLLDVREPWEYQICHIEGSKLIPMNNIATEIGRFDPEQETIVICHHGIRSRMVANYLVRNGFKNVINLSGGVKSWAEQVDPNMPVY